MKSSLKVDILLWLPLGFYNNSNEQGIIRLIILCHKTASNFLIEAFWPSDLVLFFLPTTIFELSNGQCELTDQSVDVVTMWCLPVYSLLHQSPLQLHECHHQWCPSVLVDIQELNVLGCQWYRAEGAWPLRPSSRGYYPCLMAGLLVFRISQNLP